MSQQKRDGLPEVKPHTLSPLPWAWDAEEPAIVSSRLVNDGNFETGYVQYPDVVVFGTWEHEGDAAYAIHAVNAYPSLLARCQRLEQALRNMIATADMRLRFSGECSLCGRQSEHAAHCVIATAQKALSEDSPSVR